MLDEKKIYVVKNRCAGICGYAIPSMHINRNFAPGQSLKISGEELTKLSYEPGGREMIMNYLQIFDEEVLEAFDIEVEPEYNMSEKDVINLIQNGSIDEFLDALDFAPKGVIDLIKTYAVNLPANDANKRIAIKDKTGFDVDAAIRHNQEDAEEARENAPVETTKKTRRVKKTAEKTAEPEVPTGRRTAPKKYEVVEENIEE